MARPALGKGLSALISEETLASVSAVAPEIHAKAAALLLPMEKIRANPNQPRKSFAEEPLGELAESIRQHGVLQPILVAQADDGFYEIIAGERRWRAAQLAGLTEIPAAVRTAASATDQFAMALIENIQRADLNPVELARGYKRLQDDFNLTQEAIAKAVGKDRAVVANTLRLLNLSPEALQALQEGKLSAGHARTLVALDDAAAQNELLKKIIDEQLPVRAVEEAVRAKKKSAARARLNIEGYERKAAEAKAIEEDLQRTLGRKVELRETDTASHKGWLKLEFYSLDDLDALLNHLKKSAS